MKVSQSSFGGTHETCSGYDDICRSHPLSAPAIADDSANASADKAQAMKACVDKQKATNTSMSQADMQTVCKNEAKAHKARKEGNDLATGTGKDTPQTE